MSQHGRSHAHHAPRITHRWPAALVGAGLALAPAIAAAQETGGTSDRDRVMWWTAIIAIGALLVASVGYAYRRMRGMDHPTPDELEMMGGGHGGHDASHAELHADAAVPPHAEAEHAAAATQH